MSVSRTQHLHRIQNQNVSVFSHEFDFYDRENVVIIRFRKCPKEKNICENINQISNIVFIKIKNSKIHPKEEIGPVNFKKSNLDKFYSFNDFFL